MRKKLMEIKKISTPKRRAIKRRKRYFYVLKKQSCLAHRRTKNRGQTCLLVGLRVIDNSPLPARYQITLRFNGRVRGSLKPSPLSIADFRLLRTHVVLVQASISSLHHITSQNNHTKNPQIYIHAIGEPAAIPKKSAYFYIFYVIFVDFTRL